jgi:hypothetical protein
MISPSRTTLRPTQYPRFDVYPNRPRPHLWDSETGQLIHHISLEQVPDGSVERFLDMSARFKVGVSTLCPNHPIGVRTDRTADPFSDPSPACLVQSPATPRVVILQFACAVERLVPSLGCMSVILKAR